MVMVVLAEFIEVKRTGAIETDQGEAAATGLAHLQSAMTIRRDCHIAAVVRTGWTAMLTVRDTGRGAVEGKVKTARDEGRCLGGDILEIDDRAMRRRRRAKDKAWN